MKLLLDTHVVVWWGENSPRLSSAVRDLIAAPTNEVIVSAVFWWELAIKAARGLLAIPKDLREQLHRDGFTDLPVTAEHALGLTRLPSHHRDPFDRMLIAQTLVENLVLVTHDQNMLRYDVPTIMA